jgi:hypothetical protein
MKLTPVKIVAASVAGTLALVGLGVSVHSASVHEQNCLSYERQMTADLSLLRASADQLMGIQNDIKINPFVAIAMFGTVMEIGKGVQQYKANLNNEKYAFVKTCGVDRFAKFTYRPDIIKMTESLAADAVKIQANAQ